VFGNEPLMTVGIEELGVLYWYLQRWFTVKPKVWRKVTLR
jgi:hypothetical protein